MDADDAYVPYHGTDIHERTMKCKQRFIDFAPAANDIVRDEWFEFRQTEFNLWSRTMDALSRGKSSLDYRLRYHVELRQLVCNHLEGLMEALDDLFTPRFPETPSYGSPDSLVSGVASDVEMGSIGSGEFLSESEDDDEKDEGFSPEDQNMEDYVDFQKFYIKTTISQLVRLSAKIRESGAQYRYLKADAALKEEDFEEPTRFWINDILGRRIRPHHASGFPEITTNSEYLDKDLLSIVQKRLVKANLLRLNRIEFVKKRRAIYQSTYSANEQQRQKQQIPMGLQQKSHFQSGPLTENQPELQSQQQQQQKTIAPSIQYTATAVGSKVDIKRLIEPWIVSRATRIGRRGDLEYPKCPKPLTDGASLVCPWCADLLPSDYTKSSTSWRNHIVQDILPYMCFYEQCETPDLMYASSEELMKHVDRCHSQLLWVCAQCAADSGSNESLTFTDQSSWEAHIRQEHNNTLDSADIALLAEACQKTIPYPAACPLCAKGTDASIPDDADHILWHLHQFALNCLPWDKENSDWESIDTIEDHELFENEGLSDEEGSIYGDWPLPSVPPAPSLSGMDFYRRQLPTSTRVSSTSTRVSSTSTRAPAEEYSAADYFEASQTDL